MSEIRDKVTQEIFHILNKNTDENYQFKPNISMIGTTKEILSIPEIAIVDREVKFPENPVDHEHFESELEEQYLCGEYNGFELCKGFIVKEGWVKEIKDD